VAQASAASRAAADQEYNRLLYVALTRAEDELIVCGAKPKKAMPDACWYQTVQAGFARLAAVRDGDKLIYESAQTAAPDRAGSSVATTVAPLPVWAGAAPDWIAVPPAAETTRPEPLAPSRGTEEAAKQAIAASPLAGPAGAGREAALAKGRAIHALLQHLPDVSAPVRAAAAMRFLETVPELDAAVRGAAVAAVLTILDHPDLARLFGPGSRAEVPLAGVVGDVEIGGLVDRLAVLPDRVLLADYKTDRVPPAGPETIPAGYLRQLAAYTAILAQVFPGRAIDCLLIFTATAVVMPVLPSLLVRHAPGMSPA
jgi:ATP-dependent helicase/nuclease subunit A